MAITTHVGPPNCIVEVNQFLKPEQVRLIHDFWQAFCKASGHDMLAAEIRIRPF